MTIIEELSEYRELFERSYPRYLTGRTPEIHYKIMIELMERGGKRLRPVLSMLSTELVGGRVEDVIPVAVALELFHNSTLLHDDIEDDSMLRRGKPTMHRIYGMPLALNAGDGLYGLSYEILLECRAIHGLERSWKIFSSFARMHVALVEGQAMDISFRSQPDIDEAWVIELLRKKTGALFGASAYCGAIAGGADESIASDLFKMWENVGIAFQIRDDLLNLIGEEEKYGKKIGDDISEGKPTLILMHAMKNGSNAERERIIESLNRPYNEKQIRDVIKIFEKTNAFEYAKDVADSFLREIFSIADRIPPSRERELMVKLAKYVVEREV
ncbi:MAG: polyprenyl synthetase family protein [Candidatus Syntropharchaeales archaeon]|uniref:Serralysin n=1 Tax=Candidatus Syntropharchaeum caldarium TaxID=1838285 RepID=A0A1F2PAM4_9EURY|nr:MAG: serralysin [Candidatus Syntrophoarchaeum caldarius]